MSRKSTQPRSASVPRLRFVFLAAILVVWASIIAARLIWLQVFRHAEYAAHEMRQQQRTFQIAPRRGVLYDRNLRELAMTALADSVYAVPSEITDKPATAKKLAAIVHDDPKDRYTTAAQIAARLRASRNFAWVARKVDPDVATRVRALNLKGVYLQKEFKRSYPDNDLAAQILGYVSLDDNGLGGLEYRYDTILHGKPGRVLTAVDARSQALGSVQRDPQAGENLVLTIDEHIQFIAEQALDEAMDRTKAANGTIVVQDPYTGQILALAIRPTFNPNFVRHVPSGLLRDNAVSGIYEPGSVFKLVTYSAALNEHVITPDTMINCLGGQINVAGRMVHDDRDAIMYEGRYHNVISATQALEQSSDVAAIQLAERMGKDRFYQYIRSAGFGGRTGIELPAETRGLLKPPMRWNPTTIGSIPMGQEIGVTPIQLVTMVSMIANGGMYLPPHVILRSSNEAKGGKLMPESFHPGHELPDPLPAGAHRVISTLTAAEMRKMMEGVVMQGTGIPAQLNGYSAAGKTGTAQKIDPRTHTYSKTKYIASFAGFAPVNDPAITVVVVMDSPQYSMHYGTSASAPVFHKMAQQILEYLGVPHDEPLKSTKEMAAIVSHASADDGPAEHLDDLGTLFAEINHLPADDPLRTSSQETPAAKADADEAQAYQPTGQDGGNVNGSGNAPAVLAEANAVRAAHSAASDAPTAPAPVNPAHSSVEKVNDGATVTVPDFVGQPMRNVVGAAANLGLGVRVYGNGVASEQAPAAGTHVPAGTAVVVRFH